MRYYPRTLRELLRHKLADALFGTAANESQVMRDLFDHERRMRTDPDVLQRRDAERRQANRGRRWIFAAMVLMLGAALLQLAAVLPLVADVPRERVSALGLVVFIGLTAALKRLLLPATPPWALWSHYLAYDQADADAPAAVAPWLWMLSMRTARWRYCRVVNAATGEVVSEWARPTAPQG